MTDTNTKENLVILIIVFMFIDNKALERPNQMRNG